MAFLITGGAGLVGSRIARNLVNAGDEVITYDLNPDENMFGMVFSGKKESKVELVSGDILDFDFLVRTVKGNKVDTIFHYAGILGDAIRDSPPRGT